MAGEPELADARGSLGEGTAPRSVAAEPTQKRHGPVAAALTTIFRRPASGAIVGTVALLIAFSLWAPNFLTLPSIASMLTVAAELGVVAMGVTLLMIAGEFDLSVGSVLGVSSVMVPWLILQEAPVPVALLGGLAAGLIIGLLNGLIVTKLGIPSFIVTLGALFWWRGVLFAITGGFPLSVDRTEPWYQPFSARFQYGFNASLFWFVALALILTFVLVRTRYGNWIFATGGNRRAAEQRGIPVRRVKISLFVLTGLLAAVAGIIQMGRFSSVDSLRGTAFELEAVAAAVIGGSSLTGGYGSVLGTALGCIMLGMIRTGLVLAGIPGYWYRATIGLLIVLVVIVNVRTGRVAPPR
jgi:simple sugar transport system permease protein